MSETKLKRTKQRQWGQFMTPAGVAERLLGQIEFAPHHRVLEPSFGDGAFLLPLIERFVEMHSGSPRARLAEALTRNVYGVEIDPEQYARCLDRIRQRFGPLPTRHNLVRADFFEHHFESDEFDPDARDLFDRRVRFDAVVGNPPFGGSISPHLQDSLNRDLGFRNGLKIKKETYSFFIVRGLDLLRSGGRMLFVCSDTFLTINTMKGLRELLMAEGESRVTRLADCFDGTNQPMVALDFRRGGTGAVAVDGRDVPHADIRSTGNSSWMIGGEHRPYFAGPKLGDVFVASSGMTVGRNELFVRDIRDGCIIEPYEFELFDDPITVASELACARLGMLSARQLAQIAALEAAGATRRNVRWRRRAKPLTVELPHPDYRYYNKAVNQSVYAPPAHAIYWRDDGAAVLAFKRNGNWYLRGVGGQPYFGREGLTWQLIAPRINARYLPPGYILDSGAPCAFLRDGHARDELFFALGWLLTPLCTTLLKGVINHTRNIQGKDFERLPYPFWVSRERKRKAVDLIRGAVERRAAFAECDAIVNDLAAIFANAAPTQARIAPVS